MSKMPIISIIVPVYNVDPYLRQCLDSVLAQTFSDFELILIDDGSHDNSGAICDEYAAQDNRIFVIHQENAGQGKARNVGMDQAVGKYLIFLDSDDYWIPSTLETLYAEAEHNQTQVLVFGGKVFWEGMEVPKHLNPDWLALHVQNGVVKTGPESLRISLNNREYYAYVWNRFYLLSYLRSNNLCFDEGIIHEEVRFSFLSYLFSERVECIGARLYCYRKRLGSTMASKSFQSSAYGYRVVLDGLLRVWSSHSRSKQEELLLEKYCAIRIGMFIKLYEQARTQKDWKAARSVQKELGLTLKQARNLMGLPRSIRLATNSFFLCWFVPEAKNKFKWLASKIKMTSFEERKGAY